MKKVLNCLFNIQQELKAPKGQKNTFGNYKYRSAEDILEAVKPLLQKEKCVLTLSDELINNGDRYHIKATATIIEVESGESISVSAEAREAESKKGMDDSQVTGATSSYARKYAMNGLFCIDDTKDADTDEYTEKRKAAEQIKYATKVQTDAFQKICQEHQIDPMMVLRKAGWTSGKMTEEHYARGMLIVNEITSQGA